MISVALCTYNGEKYIKSQIESILNQSMPVDEIIVVDDCSCDKTREIIIELQQQYKNKISLHVNSTNIGYVKNFEKALELTSGDFIFFSDQDDLWLPQKVKKTIEKINSENLLGVFSNGVLIDDNNKALGYDFIEMHGLSFYEKYGELKDVLLPMITLRGNVVTGATICITKEAKGVLLPFRTYGRIIHDTWIAIALSAKKRFGFIKEPLIQYRIHQSQQLGIDLKKPEMNKILLTPDNGTESYKNLEVLRSWRKGCALYFVVCQYDKNMIREVFGFYSAIYKVNLNKMKILDKIVQFIYMLITEVNYILRFSFYLLLIKNKYEV